MLYYAQLLDIRCKEADRMHDATRYAIRVCSGDGSLIGYVAPCGPGKATLCKGAYCYTLWRRVFPERRTRDLITRLRKEGKRVDFVTVSCFVPGLDPLVVTATIVSLTAIALRLLAPG